MATAKKSTTKKPAAKITAAKSTTTVKKVTATKVAPKKVTKTAEPKAFKVSKETSPFVSFRITEQTVYWSILLIYIMLLVLWISNIQLETMRIIDTIK